MAGVRVEKERVDFSNDVFSLVGVTNFEFWILEIAVAVILLVTSSLRLFEGELDGDVVLDEGSVFLDLVVPVQFWSRTFRPALNSFSFSCLVIFAISTLFKIFWAMTSSLDNGDVSFEDAGMYECSGDWAMSDFSTGWRGRLCNYPDGQRRCIEQY